MLKLLSPFFMLGALLSTLYNSWQHARNHADSQSPLLTWQPRDSKQVKRGMAATVELARSATMHQDVDLRDRQALRLASS
jgi:hypothetical protein